MDSEITSSDGGRILFDASRVTLPGPELFQAEHWPDRRLLQGGRGQVCLVDYGEQAWLIKPYLRGGFVRHFIARSYLFLGYGRTRMFREFRLLHYLIARGVPVPRPIAAWVKRSGLGYGGSIIIERLEGVQPLSELIRDRQLPAAQWQAVGRCVARLHGEQVNHKDLNASNLLLDDSRVFIIDFDRCARQLWGSSIYRRANLRRLHRSLSRLAASGAHFGDDDWQQFLSGYGG